MGSSKTIDLNKSHIPLAVSLIMILSSAPIAYAMFLTPVEIIDSTGDGSGNTLDSPVGVATDSSGNVFVAGFFSDNAFKITPGGIITEIIDSTGDGGNALDGAKGIATDLSDNVFVVNQFSANAFKITPGGIITEIIDSTGDGSGNTFGNPQGITTDSSGNVFVTAQDSDNVFKITPGGIITEIIDSTGDGSGNTFDGPRNGIATDSSGNVFVSAFFSDNAFKITPGGIITEIIDSTGDGSGNTFDGAGDAATDSSGNVFFSGQTSSNVFKITPGGIITEIIDSTGDGSGNTLSFAFGVATDSSDNVFVAGVGSNNAFKIELEVPPATEPFDPTPDIIPNPTPFEFDQFGFAVSTNGQEIVIGAPSLKLGGGVGPGSAFLFDGTGSLITELNRPNPQPKEFFGRSVSLDDDNIIVGAHQVTKTVLFEGAAYEFDSTGAFSTEYSNPVPGFVDVFGNSVDIFGDFVLIGEGGDNTPFVDSGVAHLIQRSTNTVTTILNPFPAGGDSFGGGDNGFI